MDSDRTCCVCEADVRNVGSLAHACKRWKKEKSGSKKNGTEKEEWVQYVDVQWFDSCTDLTMCTAIQCQELVLAHSDCIEEYVNELKTEIAFEELNREKEFSGSRQ